MRFIAGLVLGVLLTIGTAYVADAMHSETTTDGAPRHMVNWDVVNSNLNGVSANVQSAWNRLVGDARDLDRKIERTRT